MSRTRVCMWNTRITVTSIVMTPNSLTPRHISRRSMHKRSQKGVSEGRVVTRIYKICQKPGLAAPYNIILGKLKNICFIEVLYKSVTELSISLKDNQNRLIITFCEAKIGISQFLWGGCGGGMKSPNPQLFLFQIPIYRIQINPQSSSKKIQIPIYMNSKSPNLQLFNIQIPRSTAKMAKSPSTF